MGKKIPKPKQPPGNRRMRVKPLTPEQEQQVMRQKLEKLQTQYAKPARQRPEQIQSRDNNGWGR